MWRAHIRVGAASKLSLGHRLTQSEEVRELFNSNNSARGPLNCRQSLTKLTVNCKELHPKLAKGWRFWRWLTLLACLLTLCWRILLTACRAYVDSVSSQRVALTETANLRLAEGFLAAYNRPRTSELRHFIVPTGPEDHRARRWQEKTRGWPAGKQTMQSKSKNFYGPHLWTRLEGRSLYGIFGTGIQQRWINLVKII